MDVRFIFPMSRSLLKIAGVLALFEPVSSVGVLPESCGAGGEIVSVLAGFLSGLLAGSRAAGWFETEGLEVLVSLLSLPFLLLVGYFDGAGLFETELHVDLVGLLSMPFSGVPLRLCETFACSSIRISRPI